MSTRSTLEALFGTAPASEWWPTRPYVHHGAPDRSPLFTDIPTRTSAGKLYSSANVWSDGSYDDESVLGVQEALRQLDRQGATVKIEAIDRLVPAIGAEVTRLCADLKTPIRRTWANLYFSTAGVGVQRHVDDHEVIVLQAGGEKEWVIWHGSERMEVLMRSGSALFIPRSTPHETRARSFSSSMSVAIACYTLADLAVHAIERIVRAHASWNRVAVLQNSNLDREEAELDAILRSIGAELSAQGVLAVGKAQGSG